MQQPKEKMSRQQMRAKLMAACYRKVRVAPDARGTNQKPIASRKDRRRLARAHAKRNFLDIRLEQLASAA